MTRREQTRPVSPVSQTPKKDERRVKPAPPPGPPLGALDFFAGSGLVRLGLERRFRTVWANDVCPQKASVYRANFPAGEFRLGDVREVQGRDLPPGDLAWASFPCQDLSLAGPMAGIDGARSGLFWEWIRILEELRANGRRPPVLCAENVTGFLSAGKGRHFRAAYRAVRDLGYVAGAVVVDARWFLPQSRPRAFLIAAREDLDLSGFTRSGPEAPFHSRAVVAGRAAADDGRWVWWSLPAPPDRGGSFADVCERDAPCDPPEKTAHLMRLLSAESREKLRIALAHSPFVAAPGYRRTRRDPAGRPSQRLELRFDGLAGCLRTPEGGSSRQIVWLAGPDGVRTRLLTVRECARLMGAGDGYHVPGPYNAGYRAMGDAVAVPVTRFLAEHLLGPLALRWRRQAE